MQFKTILYVILLCITPMIAYSGPGPFGLSVGGTSLAEARSELSSRTQVQDAGTNKWTLGPMLKASSSGLGLDGLQDTLLIFDADEVLVGAILTLQKSRYRDIKDMMSEQYQMVSDEAPFVGNQLATYREDDVTIEVSAPHMSFQMEIRYFHPTLMEAHDQGVQQQKQEQQRRESSQL